MSPARRQRSQFNPFLAVLLLALGMVGGYLTLYATGSVEAQWLDDLLGRNQEVLAADTVPVIVTGRALRPGQEITRNDVWDAANGKFATINIAKEDVQERWILQWPKLEGRVMARPKQALKAFTEDDFLPVGTRPGPTALVPEGKRYLALPEEAVLTLGDLGFGDRFDLIRIRKVDPKDLEQAKKLLSTLAPGAIGDQLRAAILAGQLTLEERLVDGGVVVKPAAYDGEAGGKEERTVGVAIAPEEASPLLSSIELEQTVQCLPRSNLAGATEAPIPGGSTLEEQWEWLFDRIHNTKIYEGDEVRIEPVDRGAFAPTGGR